MYLWLEAAAVLAEVGVPAVVPVEGLSEGVPVEGLSGGVPAGLAVLAVVPPDAQGVRVAVGLRLVQVIEPRGTVMDMATDMGTGTVMGMVTDIITTTIIARLFPFTEAGAGGAVGVAVL